MGREVPTILIGWDAATFDLLLPWVREGKLPNLAAMMQQGSARVLRSVIPPISATAWVSILTGLNPGKHGIMGWKEFDARDYAPVRSRLVNSTDFAGRTLLDYLSQQDLRVCSLQVPLTYPPWKINGVMLAGMPIPDDTKAYPYPPERDFGRLKLYEGSQQLSYTQQLENCRFHINKLVDILCEALREGCDLGAIYHQDSDVFQHKYWRFLDGSHRRVSPAEKELGNPILTIYQTLDAALGRLRATFPQANFFLISDHGAAAAGQRWFYLNRWLEEQGHLRRQRSLQATWQRAAIGLYRRLKPWIPAKTRENILYRHPRLARTFTSWRDGVASVDWPKTRAFAISLCSPTAAVQVNLKNRERQGAVPPQEYSRTCDELLQELKTLEDRLRKRKLFLEVYHKEELFSGPLVDRLPDLLLVHDPEVSVRYDLAEQVWADMPSAAYAEVSGFHSLEGILVACGPSMTNRSGAFLSPASILDVAPTVLYSLGESVPEDMDGQVLLDVFQDNFVRSHPTSRAATSPSALQTPEAVYSKGEEAAIEERLRALGYLDD